MGLPRSAPATPSRCDLVCSGLVRGAPLRMGAMYEVTDVNHRRPTHPEDEFKDPWADGHAAKRCRRDLAGRCVAPLHSSGTRLTSHSEIVDLRLGVEAWPVQELVGAGSISQMARDAICARPDLTKMLGYPNIESPTR